MLGRAAMSSIVAALASYRIAACLRLSARRSRGPDAMAATVCCDSLLLALAGFPDHAES
jgi:hypothetical protein